MEKEKQLKHQLVQIDGHEKEGTFFLIDFVDGLKGKCAELKPVDSRSQIIRGIPIEKLKYVSSPYRGSIDFFCKIIVQGLKPNIGEIGQSVFFCNTIYKPYQFRPLLKYIENPDRRILIADETGLGKTIEAGYILVNEMSNFIMKRILILCPSHLQYKWKGELWHRFGLRFDIISGRTLIDLLVDKRRKFHCISSIDCLRSIEENVLLNIPLGSELDLLIIDEIHHMIGRGGETLRRKLGLALSSISKRVVGLTATPVHLELLDLKKILDVVSPGFKSIKEFEDEIIVNSYLNRLYNILSIYHWEKEELDRFLEEIQNFEKTIGSKSDIKSIPDLLQYLKSIKNIIREPLKDRKERYIIRKEIRNRNTLSKILTRTRKVEVGESRNRIIRNERIMLNSEYFEAYQNGRIIKVSEKSLFKEIDDFLRISFHHLHRRQLSSSLPAMIGLLREGMRGFNVWVGDRWEEIRVSLNENERERCKILANKFGLLTKDSKWDRLIEILQELIDDGCIRKAIVFTQWIPTIIYFRQRRHEIGFPCYIISGQDREYTRTYETKAFQKHEGFAILFTTDVMSEGVDLQSADCVINYDLPYNPQKVEQRIGRIDRIGQESDNLIIINMLIEESNDEQIYDTLLRRIGVFERGVGNLPDILLEKIERDDIIDEDEVIKALSEYEVRRELLQCDALIGLDDVLDEEIRAARMEKHGMSYSFRWMAFERLMFMVLGEKKVGKATIDEDSITFRGLNKTDVNVLANLVSIKDRAVVRGELLHFLGEDGTLKVTFNKDMEELYLPYFHPLMQKAVEISYRSFFQSRNLHEINPEMMVLKGSLEIVLEKTRHLVLAEFSFDGKAIHKREWYWWSIDIDSQVDRLYNSPLEDIWKGYKEKKITVELSDDFVQLPRKISSRILQCYKTWVSQMRKKDRANYLLMKKAEVKRFSHKLSKLRARLYKESDSLIIKEISQRIRKITETLEKSKSLVKELESDGHHLYKDMSSNSRIVAVFAC